MRERIDWSATFRASAAKRRPGPLLIFLPLHRLIPPSLPLPISYGPCIFTVRRDSSPVGWSHAGAKTLQPFAVAIAKSEGRVRWLWPQAARTPRQSRAGWGKGRDAECWPSLAGDDHANPSLPHILAQDANMS
jgi:hypothetical protein